jgi:hypothetical protein
MPDGEQQESWKPCALCAGTGKVPDHGGLSAFSARTYFTFDSELFKSGEYDFTVLYGT